MDERLLATGLMCLSSLHVLEFLSSSELRQKLGVPFRTRQKLGVPFRTSCHSGRDNRPPICNEAQIYRSTKLRSPLCTQ